MPRGKRKKKKKKKSRKSKHVSTFAPSQGNLSDKHEVLVAIRKEKARIILNSKQHQKNNKKRKNKNKNKNNKRRSNWKRFFDQLRPLGLEIRNAQSDGNCLFRAISDQMHGTQSYHAKYRLEIVKYMSRNRAEFIPFYIGNYDQYLNKMSRDGEWGGNMELISASKHYKLDIVVHQLDDARYEILYQLGHPIRSIHLSYHDGKHYASVRRIDDNGKEAALNINLDIDSNAALKREQIRNEIAWCHGGGNPLNYNQAKQMNVEHISDIIKWDDINIDLDIDDNDNDIKIDENDIIVCPYFKCMFETKTLFMFLRHYRLKHMMSVEKEFGVENEKIVLQSMNIQLSVSETKSEIVSATKQISYDSDNDVLGEEYGGDDGLIINNTTPGMFDEICHISTINLNENNDEIKETVNDEQMNNAVVKNGEKKIKKKDNKKKKKKKKRKKRFKLPIAWKCNKCQSSNGSSQLYCSQCNSIKPNKSSQPTNTNILMNECTANEWNCAICTYLNKKQCAKCEMCGACFNSNGNVHTEVDDECEDRDENEDEHRYVKDGDGEIIDLQPWKIYDKNTNKKKKELKTIETKNNDSSINNNNKWQSVGKCHCGSGKKYRKCHGRRAKLSSNAYDCNSQQSEIKDDECMNDENETDINSFVGIEQSIANLNLSKKKRREIEAELQQLKQLQERQMKNQMKEQNKKRKKNTENIQQKKNKNENKSSTVISI